MARLASTSTHLTQQPHHNTSSAARMSYRRRYRVHQKRKGTETQRRGYTTEGKICTAPAAADAARTGSICREDDFGFSQAAAVAAAASLGMEFARRCATALTSEPLLLAAAARIAAAKGIRATALDKKDLCGRDGSRDNGPISCTTPSPRCWQTARLNNAAVLRAHVGNVPQGKRV